MGKTIFITGTGTDVGKTYVTALVVKKLRDSGRNAGYYKAAISGAEEGPQGELLPGDALYVNRIAHLQQETKNLVSYVYREAVSPHLAALRTGQPIDFRRIEQDFQRASQTYDFLTMEGSGGILCPLRWDDEEKVILADLVKKLALGVLLVADAGLGTINSTALTIHYLRQMEIPVWGILLNHFRPGDFMQEDNCQMIEAMTGVPILAKVQQGDRELRISAEKLADCYA